MAKQKRTAGNISQLFQELVSLIISKRRWFFILIAILGLKFFAPTAFSITMTACVLYLFLRPAAARLEKMTHSHIASILILLACISIMLVLTVLFLPKVLTQGMDLSSAIPAFEKGFAVKVAEIQTNSASIQKVIEDLTHVSFSELTSKYVAQSGQFFSSLFDGVIKSASSITSFLFNFLIAFIMCIYLLSERHSILEKIQKFMEQEASLREKKFLTSAYTQLVNYFGGLMFLAFISGFSTFLFMVIIGLKFSLIFGVLTGLMEFIPLFGPIIAIVPILLITWLHSPALVMPIVIFFAIRQVILANIIAPQVFSKATAFSPLVIFMILLCGGEVFGLWGMVLAIPIVSVIVTFWKVYGTRA